MASSCLFGDLFALLDVCHDATIRISRIVGYLVCFWSDDFLFCFSSTLSVFGDGPAVLGLILWGIGVIPLGLIALAVEGYWGGAVLLLLGLLLTYGAGASGFWFADLEDRGRTISAA
jgi:hypothetical protein